MLFHLRIPWRRLMKGWAPSLHVQKPPNTKQGARPICRSRCYRSRRAGRDAVLIELSSEYCKIMEKRLAGEAIGTFD